MIERERERKEREKESERETERERVCLREWQYSRVREAERNT